PGKPSAELGSNTSGRAVASWGAADDNGNAVTYEVQANNAGTKTTTATSMTYTGLSNGTAYTFRVRACNQAGCSAWAGPTGKVTPYTVPSAPGVSWSRSGLVGSFK